MTEAKKLIDLEPTFVGQYKRGDGSYFELTSVEGAQGVLFICPECGNHSILCWFRNPRNALVVPDDIYPGPGRWTFTGDTFDVLTLSPSIDLSKNNSGGCLWHGYVRDGTVT